MQDLKVKKKKPTKKPAKKNPLSKPIDFNKYKETHFLNNPDIVVVASGDFYKIDVWGLAKDKSQYKQAQIRKCNISHLSPPRKNA